MPWLIMYHLQSAYIRAPILTPQKLQPSPLLTRGEFKAMLGKNIYVIEIWKIYLSL